MAEELMNLLKCPICFDFFNTCMITSCSHNYCSLCIRKYLTYKSQCPTCFEETSEPELRNNRVVDNIVKFYVERRRDDVGRSSEAISGTQNSTNDQSTMFEEHLQNHQPIPEDSLEKAPCPVCNLLIKVSSINIHLDMCLNRDERRESLRRGSSVSKRKKLAKVVYHLLSEKELKKVLADAGLNDEGDKQNLIKRHKSYLVLYNSECDSLNPRPVSEIVKQVHDDERIEEGLSKENWKSIDLDKKMDPGLIETRQKAYLKEHQSQFSQLVEDIQQRDSKNYKTGDLKRKPSSKKSTFIDGPCTSKCEVNTQGADVNDNNSKNERSTMDVEAQSSNAATSDPTDSNLDCVSVPPKEKDSVSQAETGVTENEEPCLLSAVAAPTGSDSGSDTTSKNDKTPRPVKSKLSRKITKGSEQSDGLAPVKRTRHPSDEF